MKKPKRYAPECGKEKRGCVEAKAGRKNIEKNAGRVLDGPIEDGTMDTFYHYEEGRGFLRVDNAGVLYWEDDEEQAGIDCIFEKSSDDVLQ